MRLFRPLAGISSLLLAATLVAPSAAAPRDPASPDGRGPEARQNAVGLDEVTRVAPQARGARATAGLEMPTSYPYQPDLRIYPPNVPDASDSGNLLSHDDLAPQLMEWMAQSDRISTQVVGQSTQDRDLYLVTITAPEDRRETKRQTGWREEIRDRPESAARDRGLARDYKSPVWFSSNIHGNEWEGTDASMQVIEDLVEAPWSEVSELLETHRLYFSLTLNPDGRTAGTRNTALGLNENRDMITNTTPEARSFVKTAAAIQPLLAADLHGYTGVLQVEPCGPPHGENYEYDLFIPHGYAMARQVEDDVVAADIPGNTYYDIVNDEVVPENTGPDTAHIAIPYRDIPSGWDDYPPIFTAQYAAFFGAITSTVELPLSRPSGSTQSPERAIVNTAVAKRTIESMVDYVDDNSADLVDNQIEMFRRGVAGEPKDSLTEADVAAVEGPDEWKPLWDVVDDQDPVDLPRAYVIPKGDAQRSAGDAENLVRQLILHEIEVGVLQKDTAVGGTTYPRGSYVVDMHQPLRGLANSLLDLGTDISAKVPTMYDISAWSYSYLWGATVDKVGSTTDGPIGQVKPVLKPLSDARVPGGKGLVTLDLAGIADYQALNALLEADVDVSLLEDGTAVVDASDRGVVTDVATTYDVPFGKATQADLDALDDEGTRGLDDLTVAVSGTQDDTLSLTELGFDDLIPVSSASLTADPTLLDDADVLWVASGLGFTAAQAAGRAAVQAYVDSGRSIVGAGAAGFNAASGFGLVAATRVAGNGSGNGIVAVDTPDGSVLAPFAQDYGFIYPASAFTGLGAGTTTEQSYDADPFLAGHWVASGSGVGPAGVAGLASAISGEAASGAKGFVFGTSVFFRTHIKGGASQGARALFWAGPDAEGVSAP
ncbi:M14 family zinc carboxypeptidase [Nocardioides euryhalodurans]|uniref:Peptidase M14 n=1 Tax=Nocardioides euryhalodurans TaxID=2518370 RepID=A0A4P7GIW6_9ACTN|nr:M14 family zinc carboxypeptidase [Nocardioides euryhalodurans]QBR91906.1 peptidase M14 [Nocardioides euryhalodurans]